MADAIKLETPQNAIHEAIRFWTERNGIYDVGGLVRYLWGVYQDEVLTLGGEYILKAYLDHVRKVTDSNHAIEFDHENNCWRVFPSF